MRSITGAGKEIYLTFDDGLDGAGTPAVLDVLERHQAKATFFLIADKISGNERLLKRIVDEGHALGNHSLDHKYRRFFQGPRGVQRWIESAETEFSRFGVREKLVGFRPPAGILTPPLLKVLKSRGEPLVMWSERFYDAVFEWTEEKAERSARTLEPGSIVLLHDRQRAERVTAFCTVLDGYIQKLKARGFELRALTREICLLNS